MLLFHAGSIVNALGVMFAWIGIRAPFLDHPKLDSVWVWGPNDFQHPHAWARTPSEGKLILGQAIRAHSVTFQSTLPSASKSPMSVLLLFLNCSSN